VASGRHGSKRRNYNLPRLLAEGKSVLWRQCDAKCDGNVMNDRFPDLKHTNATVCVQTQTIDRVFYLPESWRTLVGSVSLQAMVASRPGAI
jgi:hypothetical protein